ncbi:PREDICTED: transcription elongation factor 1 homolog isoform X2 [Bactrocera latifrons]|uniref:transcription elongation factor 1 homolog isoform X2 n=1 Tax=Bactrocera latifrons TaxID=174628 RepID=UPI0008DDD3B9|nr:PREDICTED: transcription elongation factor 1 homolog isoform X2 [Bactrocera latifrons]
MGRRKSKRKPPPKKKNIEPLDQQFNCPFCNHEKSCEVKMHYLKLCSFLDSTIAMALHSISSWPMLCYRAHPSPLRLLLVSVH